MHTRSSADIKHQTQKMKKKPLIQHENNVKWSTAVRYKITTADNDLELCNFRNHFNLYNNDRSRYGITSIN